MLHYVYTDDADNPGEKIIVGVAHDSDTAATIAGLIVSNSEQASRPIQFAWTEAAGNRPELTEFEYTVMNGNQDFECGEVDSETAEIIGAAMESRGYAVVEKSE